MRLDLHSGADADASSTKVAPLQIDTSSAAVKNDAVDAPSASPSSLTSSPVEENALSRPQKSALKQLGTMTQTFEELRSFTQSPQYLALAKALATFSLTASTEEAGEEGSLVAIADGTRSEPMSPISNNSHSTFLLPIFPAPTKYHFRSHDHRRASFPKSASHPRSLNININLNMNVSVHQPAKSSTSSNGRRATIGGIGHCHHHNGSQLIPSASAKQLRFSLEVQELIFLPTSPPFRISRAKPTRAHSDPAIQTMSRSSFFAPSHSGNHYQDHSSLSPAWQHSLHQAGLISTATASAASFENTTTTFIKVHASQDGRPSRYGSSRHYLPGDGSDDYYFEDCRETNGGNMTTDDEGDDEDEDDDFDEEDEEYDEFNGLARNKHGHADKNRRHRRSHHRHSRRYRLSSKNDTAAQPKDAAVRGPGVLWQVYTAVTGVKELIAWYGSMVYHSSSL
ncbi:hypothetical protein BGX33_007515 [Mortierella sp. NVP41]|nr:hypothetical protein BGX33_007515 [Mortierella sp. NVP41]